MKLLTAADALRRPERFESFLLACEADARGRLGLQDRQYPQADYLRRARDATVAVNARQFDTQALRGKAIGEAIRRARIKALEQFRQAAK